MELFKAGLDESWSNLVEGVLARGRGWRVGILRYLPTLTFPCFCGEPTLWSCSVPLVNLALEAWTSEGSGSYQTVTYCSLCLLLYL